MRGISTDLSIRVAAADFAIRCVGEKPEADRLASFIVFFETYLAEGMDETEKQMRLFQPRPRGKLKVVAGKKLDAG